eukprot:6212597-Pleurochrysis_carterae.AAC.3
MMPAIPCPPRVQAALAFEPPAITAAVRSQGRAAKRLCQLCAAGPFAKSDEHRLTRRSVTIGLRTSCPCPSRSRPSASPSFTGDVKSSKNSRGKGTLISIILRRVRGVGGRTV